MNVEFSRSDNACVLKLTADADGDQIKSELLEMAQIAEKHEDLATAEQLRAWSSDIVAFRALGKAKVAEKAEKSQKAEK